jgi:predicted CXXCH cytochrome family protein
MLTGLRPPHPTALLVAAALGVVLLTSASPISPVSRSPESILDVTSLGPHNGDCSRCHSQHGTYAIAFPHALQGPDDNTLCASCHTAAWPGGSYPGTSLYVGSSHGSEAAAVWPGPVPPARTEAGAANKCVNCHDPHGWQDATGLIPFLAHAREENLCLACHDGAPATTNIRVAQLRPYRHPTQDFAGRHTGPAEETPADFGATPLNRRHAECQDCHNPHVARSDRIAPAADDLSRTLLGTSRITVSNGIAGAVPSYTFIAASDSLSSPGGDWQVCFKCHSSWTSQPSGQTDLARVTNPNNPSYHPVQAAGRDLAIRSDAFVAGWNAQSRTPCGSCHGSDDPLTKGPHGSSYRWILRQPYDPSPAPRAMASDELCFSCHRREVYGDQMGSGMAREASRFNPPAESHGHTFHVDTHQIPCGACHMTHGSTTLPSLLVTGRTPGLVGISITPTGGTCSPTCHEPETYTTNYGR